MPLDSHRTTPLTALLAALIAAGGAFGEARAADTRQGEVAALKGALSTLSARLNWTGIDACVSTYDAILLDTMSARRSLEAAIAATRGGQRELSAFLAGEGRRKLASLTDEADYLAGRCAAPDYNGVGLSLERPAMLENMVQEWKTTIDWLNANIATAGRPPAARISRATLIRNPASGLRPLAAFKDCKERYCPEMVVVPGGSNLMGAGAAEDAREGVDPLVATWEKPVHRVEIAKPFAMARYEVTLGDFKQFVAETGYTLPAGCITLNRAAGSAAANLVFTHGADYRAPGFAQDERSPVVCVRKEDGEAYAAWLSKKTGQAYRLPSETEWEYAARGGTGQDVSFFWGNDKSKACAYATVYDQLTDGALDYGFRRFECKDAAVYTDRVGARLPNGFGLFDVLANAREFVADCWHYSYEGAPTDGRAWMAENGGLCRFPVMRGGSWAYNTQNVRTAYRNAYLSSQARSFMWGFRLARSL